jgi:hypothetical protein
MAVGAAAATITSYLNVLRGTTYTAPAGQFVQLHTADPGAAGTTAVSAVTTRNALTHNAPSGTSMTLATLGAYSMTATETISHFSVWSASSAGTFLYSGVLTASKSVTSGDTLTFTSLTVSITPAAA